MLPKESESHWHISWLSQRFPWVKQAIRPAEVSDGLCKVITTRENILEDADYNKIVPNLFIIELPPQTYTRYFQPLEKNLVQQWRDRLLQHIMITNSRLGRSEYRLGGRLHIEIRPAADLKDNQARILSSVEPEAKLTKGDVSLGTTGQRKEIAFLELINGDRRWPLYPGSNTIGRDVACDVYLDLPLIQEKRLISAQHASIRIESTQCLLLDGGPAGKPSANGTFINSRPVPSQGAALKEGDIIILAAINPQNPRMDTPGVAAFRFRRVRLDATPA